MSDMKKGNISIHAENIMPVIKRWLYSDKDIFIRELTANGCDAVTKYRMIAGDDEDLRVTVTVDTEAKELRFTDNGIGMTAEEVDRYINQVAFSSAEEFLKKYQGDKDGGIIGHFGLGFYSAFMPADKVTIDTLSYQEGAKAVRWESEDGMAYEMSDSDRAERGTTVTLHITDEEKEFLDSLRVREVLERYCGYMAVPIYLVDVQDEKLKAEEAEKAAKEAAAQSNKEAAASAAQAAEYAQKVAEMYAEIVEIKAEMVDYLAKAQVAAEEAEEERKKAEEAQKQAEEERKKAEEAQKKAEEAALASAKYRALIELAAVDTSAYNAEQKEAAKAILAEAREAIDAAVTTEEADKALETALAALAGVEKLICASDLFTDVAQEAWYHEGVDFMVRNTYMNGVSETIFSVNGKVTRGQVVTILYRIAGMPSVEGLENPFQDVSAGKFYTNAVTWAFNEGIVMGTSEAIFAPDVSITREQIAAILYRYDGENTVKEDNLSDFSDGTNVSNFAKDAMNWAVANGLINGIGTGETATLSAKTTATRSQIAVILMRYLTEGRDLPKRGISMPA